MSSIELTNLIYSLAARQDGVVNRRQLLASGVSSNRIDSRVKNRTAITSPVRTLINLAERESPKTLDTAIRRGIANGLFDDLGELNRAILRSRGRKGIRKNTVVRLDEDMINNEPSKVGMTLRKLLEDEGVVELQPISPQPVAVSDRGPP